MNPAELGRQVIAKFGQTALTFALTGSAQSIGKRKVYQYATSRLYSKRLIRPSLPFEYF